MGVSFSIANQLFRGQESLLGWGPVFPDLQTRPGFLKTLSGNSLESVSGLRPWYHPVTSHSLSLLYNPLHAPERESRYEWLT